MEDVTLIHGDAVAVLPTIPSGTVDLCLCDPPYPMIKRAYGTWTEAEWFALMRGVVPEVMRTLKPSGSAVFILQPNSERVGRMRTWLWEFMTWVGKEWGIVQDAWWWNVVAIPEAHSIQGRLLRPSVKACVWVGPHDAFRDQDAVLWEESYENAKARATRRAARDKVTMPGPSGRGGNRLRSVAAAAVRGGVLPYNMLPISNGDNNGHPGSTPLALCSWWTRYLCPPGGRVLDPFAGSGTTALAALKHGASWVGIERIPEYVDISRKRIAEAIAAARADAPLFVEG